MYENKTLYKNYTAKGSNTSDILSRMEQRKLWLKKFKENGSCEQLLIDAGVLEND